MSLTKLFFSGRFLRKDLVCRAVTKSYSNEAPKEENPKLKEIGRSEEKPVALLTAAAHGAVPKRLFSSDAPPKAKSPGDKDNKCDGDIKVEDGSKV